MVSLTLTTWFCWLVMDYTRLDRHFLTGERINCLRTIIRRRDLSKKYVTNVVGRYAPTTINEEILAAIVVFFIVVSNFNCKVSSTICNISIPFLFCLVSN